MRDLPAVAGNHVAGITKLGCCLVDVATAVFPADGGDPDVASVIEKEAPGPGQARPY